MTNHIKDFPFAEDMQQASLEGKKECTSRNHKYGEVGDTFDINGVRFEITKVIRPSLEYVKKNLCTQEGFDTPEDFEKKWVQLHPRKGWNGAQLVWCHFYKKVV